MIFIRLREWEDDDNVGFLISFKKLEKKVLVFNGIGLKGKEEICNKLWKKKWKFDEEVKSVILFWMKYVLILDI